MQTEREREREREREQDREKESLRLKEWGGEGRRLSYLQLPGLQAGRGSLQTPCCWRSPLGRTRHPGKCMKYKNTMKHNRNRIIKIHTTNQNTPWSLALNIAHAWWQNKCIFYVHVCFGVNVCMGYVCMLRDRVCTCVHVGVCVYICVRVSRCVSMCVCSWVFTYVCVCVCLDV